MVRRVLLLNSYLKILLSSDCGLPMPVISSKAYKIIGLIRKISSTVFVSVRQLLYLTFVRSRLLYCSVVWGPHLHKDIVFLERVQKRATKCIQ